MSQVEKLEGQLANAKLLVEKRDMAIKLADNREFRKLILEGFCLHEAARYVQESADPALNPAQRADALSMAQASGHVKRFLSMIVTIGNVAARDVLDLPEQIEEARVEEREED